MNETVHLAYYHAGFTDEDQLLLDVCDSADTAAAVIEKHKRTRDKTYEYEDMARWCVVIRTIRRKT